MTYDKSSFLAGVAVGRQLKGWGAGKGDGGVSGRYCTATGEKELMNRQGDSEFNRIQLTAGVRYCTMHIPGGHMYVFAASPEPLELRAFSNDNEEGGIITGRIVLGEQIYHYAYCYWYNPLPVPLVDCILPVRGVGVTAIPGDQVVVQGIQYLYGGR